jgi:hypothetical protein
MLWVGAKGRRSRQVGNVAKTEEPDRWGMEKKTEDPDSWGM